MFAPISATGTMADIKIGGYGDEGYDAGQITCCKLDIYGRSGTMMMWYDIPAYEEEGETFGPWYGWYDADGEIDYNGIPLEQGEGVWLTSPNTDIKVLSSGEVFDDSLPVGLVAGNQLCPNPTPKALTVGDAWITGYGDEGYDAGQITCCKLDIYGRSGTMMMWYDIPAYEEEGETFGPWYGWYDADGEIDYNSEALAPGESIWLTSPNATLTLNWPNPLAAE